MPATLKFVFRLEDNQIDLTKFQLLVKFQGAPANPGPATPLGSITNNQNIVDDPINSGWFDIISSKLNKVIDFTFANRTNSNGQIIEKIKIKLKDINGDKDDSNVVRFKDVEINTDVNFIYCVSVSTIILTNTKSEIDDEKHLFGKPGGTIVIGAGMP
jgi:hypothetical protein